MKAGDKKYWLVYNDTVVSTTGNLAIIGAFSLTKKEYEYEISQGAKVARLSKIKELLIG